LIETDTDDHRKIKNFYDKVYYKNATADNPPTRHDVQLARKLHVNASSKVLDVACGLGGFLTACHEKGAGVAGVDLSESAINNCKISLPAGEFHACTAEQLPFSDNSFDLITCLGSLEHFVNPVAALKEMVRVATHDAQFLILVPNKDFLTRKLGLFGGTYQVDAMEVVRTLEEWNSLFESAGLQVKSRWKDLHVMSWKWIAAGKRYSLPLRAIQALALPLWPLKWQYQVFHLATAYRDPDG
jgi:ubiquinone/menaquinone biosynthesis C-methylase UbiE